MTRKANKKNACNQRAGPAATTSAVHLSAYVAKFLTKRPAKFLAALSNSASERPLLAQAALGFRISIGTGPTAAFGVFKPKIGIVSHASSGRFLRESSWMASMMARVYLRLQRLPVPATTNPTCVHQPG